MLYSEKSIPNVNILSSCKHKVVVVMVVVGFILPTKNRSIVDEERYCSIIELVQCFFEYLASFSERQHYANSSHCATLATALLGSIPQKQVFFLFFCFFISLSEVSQPRVWFTARCNFDFELDSAGRLCESNLVSGGYDSINPEFL